MNPIRNFLIAAGAMWDSNISVDGSGYQTLIGQKINAAGSVLNGATSGTATLYQPQRGTWKKVIIALSNWLNNGGSTQAISFPVPFTAGLFISTQDLYQVELRITGSAQNINVITGQNATGVGNTTPQNNIAAWSTGGISGAIDAIGFKSGGTGGKTGLIILEGV